MDYKFQRLLGRITRIQANEGSVSIKLEKEFIGNIPEMESIFLEIEGKPVPFFISAHDYPGGNMLKVKLSGYETYEKLAEFNGCNVFPSKTAEHYSREDKFHYLTGYLILSPGNIEIGIVTGVIENPGQMLLIVKPVERKEFMVPFHEDLIIKSDRKKKLIIMELPDGLQELNS